MKWVLPAAVAVAVFAFLPRGAKAETAPRQEGPGFPTLDEAKNAGKTVVIGYVISTGTLLAGMIPGAVAGAGVGAAAGGTFAPLGAIVGAGLGASAGGTAGQIAGFMGYVAPRL